MLAFLEALAAVDVLGIQAAVKAHVAVVLEDGVVDGLNDAAFLGGIGEVGVVLAEFLAQEKAAFLFDLLIGKLLAAGLDGEIGLAEGDDFLAGVGVLDDEVTGIAGEVNGGYRTRCPPLPISIISSVPTK